MATQLEQAHWQPSRTVYDSLREVLPPRREEYPDGTISEYEFDIADRIAREDGRILGRPSTIWRKDYIRYPFTNYVRSAHITGEVNQAVSIDSQREGADPNTELKLIYWPNESARLFSVYVRHHSSVTPVVLFHATYGQNSRVDEFTLEISRTLKDHYGKLMSSHDRPPRDEKKDPPKLDEIIALLHDRYADDPNTFREVMKLKDNDGQKDASIKRGEARLSINARSNEEAAKSVSERMCRKVFSLFNSPLNTSQIEDFLHIISPRLVIELQQIMTEKELKNLNQAKAHDPSIQELQTKAVNALYFTSLMMQVIYDQHLETSTRNILHFTSQDDKDPEKPLLYAVSVNRGGPTEYQIQANSGEGFRHSVYSYSLDKVDDALSLTGQNVLNSQDVHSVVFPYQINHDELKATMTTPHHSSWIEAFSKVPLTYEPPSTI